MQNKRVAICISGQPRFFEICAPRLMAAIRKSGIEADIFIHAWEVSDEYSASAWAPRVKPVENLRQKLIDAYGPADIFIEQSKDETFKIQTSKIKKNTSAEPYIQASMFYSIYMAGVLRRRFQQINGIEYGSVVRTRFDYLIERPENHFPNIFDQQAVYYTNLIKNPEVVCDYWFSGSSEVMSLIEQSYFYMFKKQGLFNKMKICGEEIITEVIRSNRISKVPLETKGGLVRDKELANRDFGIWS